MPAGKPDPRAFLCAAERLALGPSELLLVGNSPEKDVRGALMVGMDAVLLDRHDAHPGVEVRRVRSLEELALGVSSS